MDKKREEFKQRREAAKFAKAEADDIREQELAESFSSSELIPITESNQIEELNSFTVVELKSKLSQMGLKVSGKKTELIERLNQALNQYQEDWNQSDESMAGVEQDGDIMLIDHSSMVNSSSTYKDSLDNILQDTNLVESKLRKSLIYRFISRILAGLYLILGLTIIGVLEGIITDLFGLFGQGIISYADNFHEGYGGMNDTTRFILRIDVDAGFFLAAYWIVTRRAKWAFYVMLFTIPASILFRIIVAINAGSIEGVSDYWPPIHDAMISIPFLVTAAIPWMATHELGLLPNDKARESNGLIHVDGRLEEELIDDTNDTTLNQMDQFAVTRPTPPRRRRPMEFPLGWLYEATERPEVALFMQRRRKHIRSSWINSFL